jgi:very-short-patch-repair endonuclease
MRRGIDMNDKPRRKRDDRAVGVVMGYHTHFKSEEAQRMRRSMTPAEARLWDAMRTNRLAGLHFRRQQVIDGFIADFYCHEVGLVVEVDGGIHEDNWAYDAERDRILATRGLRTIRFGNDDIFENLPQCLQEILRAVQEHGGLPLPESGRGPGG